MARRCTQCGEVVEGEDSCSACGSRDLRPLRPDELGQWQMLAHDRAAARRRAVMVRCGLDE